MDISEFQEKSLNNPTVAFFVALAPKTNDIREIALFKCCECDEEMISGKVTDHAKRIHQKSMISIDTSAALGDVIRSWPTLKPYTEEEMAAFRKHTFK